MTAWLNRLPIELIDDVAIKVGLDPNVVAAIVMVESAGNPWAVRFEPQYRWVLRANDVRDIAENEGMSVETLTMLQRCSFGLMQIMAAVAIDEYRFRGYPTQLCDPYTGLFYGCLHLKSKFVKYADEDEAVSAYNCGTPVETTGGLFANQKYVDKVYFYLRQLRG
jgi:soluble lytic murein transglycosylase-like protein